MHSDFAVAPPEKGVELCHGETAVSGIFFTYMGPHSRVYEPEQVRVSRTGTAVLLSETIRCLIAYVQ
jgi:hypothetical protein